MGLTPLTDLGPRLYEGYMGGLYPDGSSIRPADHLAAGIEIAQNQIQPLDAEGNPDPVDGKIVLISVGMSNTHQEFGTDANPGTFEPRAEQDPSVNPQLVIVNGAQGGEPADSWADPASIVWETLDGLLAEAGVTPQQVQVAWVKQAISQPQQVGDDPDNPADFLEHVQTLQGFLEDIARNLKARYPNTQIAFHSSRTRAYISYPEDLSWGLLNPEPYAYESGFAVKWMIERQINGELDLNYDPLQGPVVAPFLVWGPYLWSDGLSPRSDGFVWECADVRSDDFTHPSQAGATKVSDQLMAFFKTDPMATPWFLSSQVTGEPPSCSIVADVTNGESPMSVNFTAEAIDPDGTIVEHAWTYSDGTFAYNDAEPSKIFPNSGQYDVYLTVSDDAGNNGTCSTIIDVTGSASSSQQTYRAGISGSENVPPTTSAARGSARFTLDKTEGTLSYRLEVSNISDATAAYIRCAPNGANGPVGITLYEGPPVSSDVETVLASGTITMSDTGNKCGWLTLNDVIAAIETGGAYTSVHTSAYPDGEIRGQIVSTNVVTYLPLLIKQAK